MNRWRKWPLAAVMSFVAGWTVPARASVLLYTQADTAASAGVQGCSQQFNSFGPLVTSTCGPMVAASRGVLTTLGSTALRARLLAG